MGISQKKKKYIRRNCATQSVQQLAQALELSPKEVAQALKEMGLEPSGKKPAPEKAVELKPDFKLELAIAATIVLAVFAIYLNALPNGLVMDDYKLIRNNPTVAGEAGAGKIFRSQFADGAGKISPFYRPLIIYSYVLDHRFWKDNPRGYHLTNIVAHALVSVLVFLGFSLWAGGISSLKDSRTAIGAFAGLLFAVHPAHTQSVTWISGRTDVVAALFCLLSFYLYFQSANRPRRLELALIFFALGSFFLALLAKEVAVVFPVLLILADYAQKGDAREMLKPRKLIVFSAFFAIAIMYLMIRQKVLGFPLGSTALSFSWYSEGKADVSSLVRVCKTLFYYLETLIYPTQLSFECKLRPSLTWSDPQIYFSVLGALVILAAGVWTLFRRPWLALGIFWFLLPLLPVSNLSRQIGIKELTMDHYLYLPSMGFCLALAIGIEKTGAKLGEKYRAPGKGLAFAMLAGILACFAILTWQRNPDWKSEMTIWKDAVKKAPTRKRSITNLANEYMRQGDKEKVIFYFRLAAWLIPQDVESHYNLGVSLAALGRQEQAIAEYEETIRLNPMRADAHNNLGSALQSKNDWEGAIRQYKEAGNANPNYALAWNNLGNAYLELGRCDQAWQARYQVGTKANSGFLKKLQEKCPR